MSHAHRPADPPPSDPDIVGDVVLVLTPARSDVPARVRLRALLKALLRGYGFVCREVRPAVPPPAPPAAARPDR